LPKLVKAATCEKLKAALLTHLKETEGHVTKLEQVFKSLDHKAKGKTCKTTVAYGLKNIKGLAKTKGLLETVKLKFWLGRNEFFKRKI